MGNECKSQISLCNAAEILGITTENYELHNAKDDSLLCAALLKEHYCKERFDRYIKDTKNPEFFKRLCFKPYFINDINDTCVSKQSLDFYCQICGGKMKQLPSGAFATIVLLQILYAKPVIKNLFAVSVLKRLLTTLL